MIVNDQQCIVPAGMSPELNGQIIKILLGPLLFPELNDFGTAFKDRRQHLQIGPAL